MGSLSPTVEAKKKSNSRLNEVVFEEIPEQISEISKTASQKISHWSEEAVKFAKRNPLITVGGALAAGLVVGLVMRSRKSK